MDITKSLSATEISITTINKEIVNEVLEIAENHQVNYYVASILRNSKV